MSDTEFTVTLDDNEIKLFLVDATIEQQNEANKIYNKTFADSLKSGALLRAETERVLKERGIWDDEKEQELIDTQKEIRQKLKTINSGNIKLWSDARNLALGVKKLRYEMRNLLVERTNLDNNTAEAQAENMRFSYYVSVCTVAENKQPYFNDLNDYLNCKTVVGFEAAKEYADLLYGLGSDLDKSLPENKFMLKYNLCNDDLKLINKDGCFVDDDMRLINKDGRYIDKNDNFVNVDGESVDDAGNLVVEEQLPFLDEDGDVIPLEVEESETKEVVIEV